MTKKDRPLCMPFGKFKGVPVDRVPLAYLRWMQREGVEVEHDDVREAIEARLGSKIARRPKSSRRSRSLRKPAPPPGGSVLDGVI